MNLEALSPNDCRVLGIVDFYSGESKISGRAFFELSEQEKWYFLGWYYAKDRSAFLESVLQSANAGKPQAGSTPEKSANQKQ